MTDESKKLAILMALGIVKRELQRFLDNRDTLDEALGCYFQLTDPEGDVEIPADPPLLVQHWTVQAEDLLAELEKMTSSG